MIPSLTQHPPHPLLLKGMDEKKRAPLPKEMKDVVVNLNYSTPTKDNRDSWVDDSCVVDVGTVDVSAYSFTCKSVEAMTAIGNKEEDRDVKGCPFCHESPCIIDCEDAIEEGSEIVDWLNEEQLGCVDIPLSAYRFYLWRMYARHLEFKGPKKEMPKCVLNYIDLHFRDGVCSPQKNRS